VISAIPLGVVIVDTSMRIIECNERFAILAGEDARMIYEQRPGMVGAVLDKVLPVGSFFRHVSRLKRILQAVKSISITVFYAARSYHRTRPDCRGDIQ
jgi:hypothetical protein